MIDSRLANILLSIVYLIRMLIPTSREDSGLLIEKCDELEHKIENLIDLGA